MNFLELFCVIVLVVVVDVVRAESWTFQQNTGLQKFADSLTFCLPNIDCDDFPIVVNASVLGTSNRRSYDVTMRVYIGDANACSSVCEPYCESWSLLGSAPAQVFTTLKPCRFDDVQESVTLEIECNDPQLCVAFVQYVQFTASNGSSLPSTVFSERAALARDSVAPKRKRQFC